MRVRVRLVPAVTIEFGFKVIYCPLIEHVSEEREGDEQVAESNEIYEGRENTIIDETIN